MYKRIVGVALILSMAVFIHGCGSSEKSSQTKAVATMKGVTLATGQVISALKFSLLLPKGVTAQSVTLNGVPPGEPSTSNQNAGLPLWETFALSEGQTELRIAVLVASGFGEGQSIEIDCAIDQGTFPTATSFLVYDFEAKDQNGVVITGLQRLEIKPDFY